MKKIILIILFLGIIFESKAQFPASNEIHYYVSIDSQEALPIAIAFADDHINWLYCKINMNLYKYFEYLYKLLVRDPKYYKTIYDDMYLQSYYYYDKLSTAKYYTYVQYASAGTRLSVTKDRMQLIIWGEKDGQVLADKRYYKRVSKSEIERRYAPNIDFLK